MKTTIKTTLEGITGLSELLNTMLEYKGTSIEDKATKSICLDIFDKVSNIIRTARKNATLFSGKKQYTLTLKYHEAFTIHQLLAAYLNNKPIDDLMKTALNTIKDTINQKLSQ